ncbi:microtubule-associated protein futsch isoform X5 [Macrobrachium rosenbergii]|uniref:microtubule-associated protein futsch isoform X5 n=1 Tax=Macrobrachium rosenbergii TaxID=79674 RepID=UPI0034D68E90
MLSMCGLLCRMLRGWRHSEAVMLMAKALSQPQSTLLVQNMVDSSSGTVTVNEPNSTSAFCQNSSDGTVGQMIWRDNNKQAVIVIPRQQVDLKRWTLFLASSSTQASPHSKTVESNEHNAGSSDVSGTVTILLEASYRDHETDMASDHHVMVEHLSQPYAWKARGTFGVIVMATPPQLLAMIQAFFNNALLIDDDFVITKILTVDLVGEPSTLDDPLSIPESVTPGPFAERGLTQLEYARSISPSGFPVHQLPAIAAKDLEARSNSLHPPSLSHSMRHQSSENSTEDTSTTLNPQSSTDSDKHASSLDPQSSYDSVSDYPTSDTDDVPCNVYNFYPRGWAISGSHVISGQPLSVRGVLNQLEGKQYRKPCSIVTNPMEDLWNDPDDSGKRRGSTCTLYSLQRSSCLNGPSSKQEDRTSLLKGDRMGPECLPRYTCISGAVICKSLQAEPGRAERQIVREAAEHYRRAITSSQERRSWTKNRSFGSSGEEDNGGASSQHSFSGSNTQEKSVVTREPRRYPVRIKSEADLSRATSLIKDNLANIVENYLVKQSGSPDFQYQFPKVQMENPTLKLPRPLRSIEPEVYMNGRVTEIQVRKQDEAISEEPSSVVPIVITEIKTPTREEPEEPSEFREHEAGEADRKGKVTEISEECSPTKAYQSEQGGSILVSIPPEKILPRVSSDPEEPFVVRGNKFKLKIVDANIPGVHGVKPKEVGKSSGKTVRKLVKSDELPLPTIKREGRIDIPVGMSMEVDLYSLSKEAGPEHPVSEEVPQGEKCVVDLSGSQVALEKVTDQAKVTEQNVIIEQLTDEAGSTEKSVTVVSEQVTDEGGSTEKSVTCEKVTDKIDITRKVLTPEEVTKQFDITEKNVPSEISSDSKPSVISTVNLIEVECLSEIKDHNGTALESPELTCDGTILPVKTTQEKDQASVNENKVSRKVDTVLDHGVEVVSSMDLVNGSVVHDSCFAKLEDAHILPEKKSNGLLISAGELTDSYSTNNKDGIGSKLKENTFAGISIILEEKTVEQESKDEEAVGKVSDITDGDIINDAVEKSLGEFLEGNNNRGSQKPRCLKDTHKLDTKSSTASESSFESLPYRMLSSQPDSLTDDVVIELTRAPIDSEKLRVAKQELLRLERMNAISMASQYMTESKDDFSPEEHGPESKVTHEGVMLNLNGIHSTEHDDPNQDPFNSSLFDSGVEGMHSDQNSSGGSSIAKVLPSPVESTTESGFSSLKEQLPNESLAPEEEKYGGHDGVSLSKSKDSLDLTDTDRFPGTDTLSDDMETLSSTAGDLTLVESGPVSKEGSARGSMSDSVTQESGFMKVHASEQAGVNLDSFGIPSNFQSTPYHAGCDIRGKFRSASHSQKSSMDSSSLSAEIPETKSKAVEDLEESSQTVSVNGDDKSKCTSDECHDSSKMKTSESLSSEDTVVSRVSLEEQAGKMLRQGSQEEQSEFLDGQMQITPVEERASNHVDGGIGLKKTAEGTLEFNINGINGNKTKVDVGSLTRLAADDSIVPTDTERKSEASLSQLKEKPGSSEDLVSRVKTQKSSSFTVMGDQGKQPSVADLIEMYDSKDSTQRERTLSSKPSKPTLIAVEHQGAIVKSGKQNGIKCDIEETVSSSEIYRSVHVDSPKIVESPAPGPNGSIKRRSDAARKSDVSDRSSPNNQETYSTSDRPSRHSSKSGISDLEDEVFLPPSENYIFDGRPVIYCPKIDMANQVKVEPPKMAMSVFTVVPSKELGSSKSKDWRDLSTMGTLPSVKDFYNQQKEDMKPSAKVSISDTSTLSSESTKESHLDGLLPSEKVDSEQKEFTKTESVKPQDVVEKEPVASKAEIKTSVSQTEKKSPGSRGKSLKRELSPKQATGEEGDAKRVQAITPLVKDVTFKTDKQCTSSPTSTVHEGTKVQGKQEVNVMETSKKLPRGGVSESESLTLNRTSTFSPSRKNDTIPVVTPAKQPILSPVLQSAISPRATYDPFTGDIIDSEVPVAQGENLAEQNNAEVASEVEGAQKIKPKLSHVPNLEEKDAEAADGDSTKKALPVKKVEIKILDNADSRPRELPVLSPVAELRREKLSRPVSISDDEMIRVSDKEETSGQRGEHKDLERRSSGRKEESAIQDLGSKSEVKSISDCQNSAGVSVRIESRTSEESEPEKVRNQSSVESCESTISIKSDTRRPSKGHSEHSVSSLKNSGWCVGGSLEFLEKHSGEVRLRSRKEGSISSAKSEDLSMKCDKASLKSQGSLDKFPHFDQVSAQQRSRGARKKILSVDIDSGEKGNKSKNKEMHRSATLPVGTLASSKKEKEEKKKEKEDKSKKKKKEKEASGGSEKKSTMMSLKGLLKRSKLKDKDKEKDSSSQEKLSSPSLFRKFERKSRGSTQSPSHDEHKHGEKGSREIAASNPNLQRTGSPFVRGLPHSSSFTSSPFRRPHSSAAVFSPAKRGLSTPGGPSPPDGTPGSQLMRVEEEGPCRKNLDNETEKPPNVLVYAANKTDYYVAIKETLKSCLNQDRYIIYQLTDEMAFKSPWAGSTTLLVVCGDVPAHISTAFIRYLLQGGRVLSICSDFLNMAVPLFAFELPWTSSLVASGTVEVQEQAVVSVSYHQWSGVQLLHHQHCFHSSPQHKRFSREVEKPKAIPSRSAVSVEPTHVEITDEWGGRHRLNLTILATDDTWGAPSLLSAKLHGSKGKAVFSQVHLERDPRECFGASEVSAKLSSSNEARLEILRDLLSTELSMDTTQTNAASLFTAAYALGRHELKQELLTHLKPHMEGQELKRPQLTIQFIASGETPQKPDEHILPIYMNACPMTFSTVKYYEALKTTSVGRLLIYCDVMSSSMRVTAGHPPLLNGLVVIPSQQTHGKGRGGNAWLSPLGCAMFTIQLHVALSSTLGQHLSFIQHLIAIAVADAVRDQPGYSDIPVCLKWPNDIYIGRDLKIGGVIVEASTMGNVVIANIGCGINLSNSNPTYCINDAIRQHNKDNDANLPELEREVFFARTFNAFEQLVNDFQKSGPEAVVHKYYKYWLHSNATVIVQNENFKSESAIITGVDNFGFLEAQLISGALITLHPDGNSFNMMEGLIYSKCRH